MVLNFEQIKGITQGAENITFEDSSVRFFRFNSAEEKEYIETEFNKKIYSTAGIQLEFNTDGDTLSLDIFTKAATSRSYFSLDVFVNDEYLSSLKNHFDVDIKENYTLLELELGKFSQSFDLGKGDKKVRVVLPWSVATEIRKMELVNATYVNPVKKSKKVIMYGDSITNGYDALYTSNSYATKFANAMGAEVYNKAIGGEIFFPALARVKSTIQPDFITVAYGTNDWSLRECDDFKRRCSEFYDTLANNYPNIPIFAITPIWRADHLSERKLGLFEEVEKFIKETCSKHNNIKVISGWDLVPHDKEMFADFRLHPNDNGFDYHFNNLKTKIDKFI